jgi:hypothetical protein
VLEPLASDDVADAPASEEADVESVAPEVEEVPDAAEVTTVASVGEVDEVSKLLPHAVTATAPRAPSTTRTRFCWFMSTPPRRASSALMSLAAAV